MIKKISKLLDYNPVTADYLHTIPIEINDSNKVNDTDPIVYFDAAFSRKVVDEKSAESRFVYIKENSEQVYFIYDPENFSKESNYKEFTDLINSQKDILDVKIEIYSGLCVCIYNTNAQSISMYPVKETKITDPDFKLI